MTKDEAWRIITECRGWNCDQKSIGHAFGGTRTSADDAFDAKRAALAEAWKTVGKPESTTS